VTVYRARRAGAVVVSLFALAAQLLTVFGASAGADLVLRVFDGLHIDPGSSDLAVAIVTVVILAAVFAYGSLTFTVAAISAAPQVVMFLGLTHTMMGLDRSQRAADAPPGWAAARPEFRWFTWPMRIGIVLAVLAAIGGLLSLNA
jgi:hypothetical protein